MKRKNKNILAVLIIFILIGCMLLTIRIAKNDSSSNVQQPSFSENQSMIGEGQTPPDKPNGENSGEEQAPPDKPDGENSEEEQAPPDKSNGENNEGKMSLEKTENENKGELNQIGGNIELKPIYYAFFGIESLLLSAIILYLMISKMNAKTCKQTFTSLKKTVFYIISTIILTLGFIYGDSSITNYLISTNIPDSPSFENNPNGMNNQNITYSAKNEITESQNIADQTYESNESDENALLISGSIETTVSDIEVTKTGDSDSGDNTSFYGINSAILAKDGAVVNLDNVTVTTDATGANGVFSYGGSATTSNSSSYGTTINISNSTITTSKDNSGGIMTTGGGVMNATNLTITTAGTSSAAIRTDRGGGIVNVNGGTYKTTGQGSPTIYSTANITVKNADLIATASEGIVIEGKNSVTIESTSLTDSNTKLNGKSTTYKNIFMYQSVSGDAEEGTSEFTAKNSNIITNNGDTFYITNTSAKINLTNNTIVNNDINGNFLRAQADSWGNNGSNGGNVTLTMNTQEAIGNIVIDSVSTLDMTLTSSHYEGTINGDNTAKKITLTLDSSSTITLTEDSYVTSLEDEDSSYSNINFNGYKLYVNGKAINS